MQNILQLLKYPALTGVLIFQGANPAVPAGTRFTADAEHSIIFTASFYLAAGTARYMIDIELNMNLEL